MYRVGILLAMLIGCDDASTGEACAPSREGMTPEDYVPPVALNAMDAGPFRDCVIMQRMVIARGAECTDIDNTDTHTLEYSMQGCQGTWEGDTFLPECWNLWAAGTCDEIADSKDGTGPLGCSIGYAAHRAQGTLRHTCQ
jgi:hypothetical protein